MSIEGDGGPGVPVTEVWWQVEAVDGVEEEEGADAFVKIQVVTSEGIEFGAGMEQGICRGVAEVLFKGLVADLSFWAGDEIQDGRLTHACVVELRMAAAGSMAGVGLRF